MLANSKQISLSLGISALNCVFGGLDGRKFKILFYCKPLFVLQTEKDVALAHA